MREGRILSVQRAGNQSVRAPLFREISWLEICVHWTFADVLAGIIAGSRGAIGVFVWDTTSQMNRQIHAVNAVSNITASQLPLLPSNLMDPNAGSLAGNVKIS